MKWLKVLFKNRQHEVNQNYLYFTVNGAGDIRISTHCKYQCALREGFMFGVEWGKHGFVGGLLSKEDAKKLAEHILDSIK